ncbi:MAG: hypothetical protein K2M16_05745 [Muribaculaceae bacterium]|nr:hypothetical protein [Muribaculaceae bacterium]
MNNRTKEITLTILLGLTVIVATGVSMGFHHLTIVEWWKPAIFCALIATGTTVWLAPSMKRLTEPFMSYIEYPVAYVLSFSVMMGLFYTVNYCLSDNSSGYAYKAPVVRKYREERTRSHRTGRRAYREEKYSVYVVELEMKDGRIKKFEKPLSEYNRIKERGTVDIFVEDGFFKIPVIKNKHKQP